MTPKLMIKTFLLLFSLWLAGWGMTLAASAQAQVILAECNADGSGTSAHLRAAIQLANDRSDLNVIHLSPNCVYQLDNALTPSPTTGDTNLPSIEEALVIEGFGATLRRPAGAPAYRILLVEASVPVTITNVTFENGHALLRREGPDITGSGGAILLSPQASLALENVNFINNQAQHSGGAIFAVPGRLAVKGGQFENNRAGQSGGAVVIVGNLDLSGARFIANQSDGDAGALHLTGTGQIERNEFLGNKALGGPGGAGRIGYIGNHVFLRYNKFLDNQALDAGGGIYIRNPSTNPGPFLSRYFINNNLWVNNQATQSGSHLDLHVIASAVEPFELHYNTFVGGETQTNAAGVTLHEEDAGQGPPAVPAKIFNNIIVNHSLGIQNVGPIPPGLKRNLFFNNQTLLAGEFAGNVAPILADPLFVDPANRDFRLQPCSVAIDQAVDNGSVANDLDGVVRPQGEGFDLGVYEFVGTPSSCPDNPTPTPTPFPDPNPSGVFSVYLPVVVK